MFVKSATAIVPSVPTPGSVNGAPGECLVMDDTPLADVVAVGAWYQKEVIAKNSNAPPPTGDWPLAGADWQYPRYKVAYFGGTLTFTPGLTAVVFGVDGLGNLPDFTGARVVGGYIRQTSLAVAGAYTVVGRIAGVPGLPGTTLELEVPWAGPLAVLSSYAIFLPILDTEECHLPGPDYRYGTDFCEIPNSQGSVRMTGAVDPVFPAVGVADEGLSPEFSRVSLFSDVGLLVQPGMSFRFLSEPVEQPHGIVWVGPDYNGIPGDNVDILVWPPIALPAPIGTHYEILGRTQYFVTGNPQSTIVSVGANPVIAQVPTDTTAYQANCCAAYARRIFIGTDLSYTDDEVGAAPAIGPNGRVKSHHPARIAWSAEGTYRKFDGDPLIDGNGIADLEIGPVLWMFVMRDTLYCVSQTGIVSINETGIIDAPIRLQTLFNNRHFAPWGKPSVISESLAMIPGTDDLYAFDGATLTAVTGKISQTYQYLVASGSSRPMPAKIFYEQNRGRVFISRGVFTNTGVLNAPFFDHVIVGDVLKNDWTFFQLPVSTGGGATWSNAATLAAPIQAGRVHLDTELMMNTVGLTDTVTNQKDRVYALRWSRQSDENAAGTLFQIPWHFEFNYFDMDAPRDFKTVSRVRLVSQLTTVASLPLDLTVERDNGDSLTGTIDVLPDPTQFGPPLVGKAGESFFTGVPAVGLTPAVGLNLTGYSFKIRIGQTDLIAPTGRPILREFGITFRMRKEVRQL
jgi:hypothetical protein